MEVVSLQLKEGFARGRIHLLNPDTLSLLVDSVGQLDLALNQIAQLRVNVGKDLTVVLGAAAGGALLGAVLAPMIASKDPLCESGFDDVVDCGQEVPDWLIGLAAGGAGAAKLTYAVLPRRWVHVRLDLLLARLTSSRVPVVALGIRF